MKTTLNCTECNHTYEGIENEDLLNPRFTHEENQINFHKNESWTHRYIIYKKLEALKEYTDQEEKEWKWRRGDFENSITSFSCSNEYENECLFSGSISQILEHEKLCMGINNLTNTNIIKENENYLKCDLCNQKFYDYPNRKLKLQYQLNFHKKRCRKTYMKKRKILIKQFIDEKASDDLINSFIKQADII
tara:strand:- start:2338 stop:2910 length:573 start_codon:yes stop_codon:yes gene_type:complete